MAQGGSKVQAALPGDLTRRRILVKGVVQGVGFRPYVYNLAKALGLAGHVLNSARGVTIEVEGPPGAVEGFCRELETNPPRLARILAVEKEELEPRGYRSFAILRSREEAGREALVPPDVALCPQCRADVLNRRDRHYAYPFTNCTNCGPRFTIVRDLPYDRHRTSMAGFPMCPACRAEYKNPGDRRFHAQPVACPRCGPRVWLEDGQGKRLEGHWLENFSSRIRQGQIAAIKGLGGFHLVCDAQNREAVSSLRRRKGRPAKPLAVMCRDLDTVRKYCLVEREEAELLAAPEAPIVILTRKEKGLPRELAPGLKTLGVMLPYTPLHLLFFEGQLEVLVMTSGNKSELPLARENGEALEQLGQIADFFLCHDREIVNRCDDSLARVLQGETHLVRRSRGYVPRGIQVPVPAQGPVVLGMGGEMKNTFCLLQGPQAFLSQHMGELDSLEAEQNLLQSLERFSRLMGARPSVVAYDMHPAYSVSRLAGEMPARQRVAVQHHHAHLASCLADNGSSGPAIGVLLDGTGYGTDGCIWGFEIMSGDYRSFRRHYHLKYVPLPGGERAVRNPWMMAVAYLYTCLGRAGLQAAEEMYAGQGEQLAICRQMVERGFNSPPTSSCGRLFDAVASLLGICQHNTYEGQAAVELSELLPPEPGPEKVESYPFAVQEGTIDPQEMIRAMLADLAAGVTAERIALKFHHTIGEMVGAAVEAVAGQTGLKTVALSGGVWQNPYLFLLTRELLRQKGLTVLYHRQVPCNDGGLSLGQVMIAGWRWMDDVPGNTGQNCENRG